MHKYTARCGIILSTSLTRAGTVLAFTLPGNKLVLSLSPMLGIGDEE